jgi:hypothetical protein
MLASHTHNMVLERYKQFGKGNDEKYATQVRIPLDVA